MIRAGLDIARLNFSHGTAEDHRGAVARLARAARKAGRTVAVLADLQGPRFRVGSLPGGELRLEDGATVELVAGRKQTKPGAIPVSYAALAKDVRRGGSILLDDGKIALTAERVRNGSVFCRVIRGGVVTDRKGINLPGASLSVPTLTAKDKRDLVVAVEAAVDCLAVSFVRGPEDVRAARRLTRRAGRELPIMAKIERPEAVDRLDEILAEADGLLVARGDLGVEIATERVPIVQKQIIEAANAAGKPVMTATQMLESMRLSPRPTRAEASDVANAVLDGSDSLLLTAETAAGRFPVESVATMDAIVREAEDAGRSYRAAAPLGELSIPLTACRAGCRAAFDVHARYIVVLTQSGFSARQTARFRPVTPILAFSPSGEVVRSLNLLWGVEPQLVKPVRSFESMRRILDEALLKRELASKGDVVVVLSGAPIGVPGTTNLIKIHRVGEAAD